MKEGDDPRDRPPFAALRLTFHRKTNTITVQKSILKCEGEHKMAKEKKVEIYFPELSLCGDNAAMVGAQGYFEYVSGTRGDMTLNARATLDIDSVQ